MVPGTNPPSYRLTAPVPLENSEFTSPTTKAHPVKAGAASQGSSLPSATPHADAMKDPKTAELPKGAQRMSSPLLADYERSDVPSPAKSCHTEAAMKRRVAPLTMLSLALACATDTPTAP